LRLTPILVLLSSGLLVVPAAARAGGVATDMPCYVEGQPGSATLTGFTPGADVEVRGDQIYAAGRTDAAGALTLPFTAPLRATDQPGSDRVVLTVKELTGPAPQPPVTAAFRVTTLSFATTGGTRSPKAMRTWTFSGFRPGKPVYGHFRFGGRTRANHRFGVATAPCGELRRRAPAFPIRGQVSPGTWRVQVDQRPTYARTTSPRLATSVTIFTRFEPRAVWPARAGGR
jgi:hypothetical protein